MSEENKTLIYTELLSGTVGGYVTDYSQIKNTPTINLATVTSDGLMSAADKTKLNSVATGAGYEANLQWGGRNIADGYSPLDASMISALGANRFNCYPINKVNIEYSRDAGNTWFDYDATDIQKQNLFVESKSSNIQIGGVGATPSINNRVRITIDTDNTLYARLRKFVIYITNNFGAIDKAWVTITARTQQNYEDNIDTWVTFTDKANIHGFSGWNVINTDVLVTYGNQKASQYGEIRFTFGIDELKSSSNIGLFVLKLMAFGQAYSAPNDLAMNDKPYKYNYDGSIVLPKGLEITGGEVKLANFSAGKINGLYNSRALANNSIALGYYSQTGIITEDPQYPYGQIVSVSPLNFNIGDDSLYGVSLAKGDSTTYTYNGVDYTVKNPNNNSSASVFLIKDTDNMYIKGTSFPMNVCVIARDYIICPNSRILAVKNIIEDIWEIIVIQQNSTILSYTSPLNIYIYQKSNGGSFTGAASISCGSQSCSSGAYSFSSNQNSIAASEYSTSMGRYSIASGSSSIALGGYSVANGVGSISLGLYSKAGSNLSTALGAYSNAKHSGCFVQGYYGISGRSYQTVLGNYNLEDSQSLLVIGNGSASQGKNIFTVGANGGVNMNGALNLLGTTSDTSVIRFHRETGNYIISPNNSSLYFNAEGVLDSTKGIKLNNTGLLPCKTNSYNLGSASYRWNDFYVQDIYLKDSKSAISWGNFNTVFDKETETLPTGISIWNSTGSNQCEAPSNFSVILNVKGYYTMQLASIGGNNNKESPLAYRKAFSGEWESIFTSHRNITPKKEGLNIGSSANKWNEVHASNFYGDLDGTATKVGHSLTITNGANSVVFDGSEDKVIDIQSLNEGNSIPKFSRIERNEISTDMIVEGSTPLVGEIIYLDNSHPLSDGFYWYAKDGKYYKWWASANLFKNESTFVTSPNKIFECGEDGQQYVFVPTSYNDDGTAIYGQLLKLTDTKMLDVTYIDLKNLVDDAKLIKGMQYRITDFVTTCNNSGSVSGVNTSSANHPFDIIVTADDNGTLNANARVCLHEGDTYFANNKISEWVIKYDIKNDTDKYQWADTINGKGVIYYMCDEFGNEAPYDFKNILFGNYYTFSLRMTAITDLSLEGKYCYENKIKGNYEGEKLILNHIRMINTTQNTAAKNILGVNCTNIHLTGTCYDNNLSNSCRDITLPTCSNISFASNCVFISMSTGMRNVCVKNGVQGSSSEPLAISALTGDYVTTVAKNSAGVIKIYNEADLVP